VAATVSAIHLFGDSDEFEHGFQLGVVWQLLRSGLDSSVVLPTALVARATRIAEATGFRVAVRKPRGLHGLRHLKFTAVKGTTT
jgi:hypothetical protein